MKKKTWTVTLELNENVRRLTQQVALSDREADMTQAVKGLFTIGCLVMDEFLERRLNS